MKIINCLMLLLASMAANADLGMTKDHVIYENLFLKLNGDSIVNARVVEASDNIWFSKNELASVLESTKELDAELVKRLYKINKKSIVLNWKPVMVSIEFLPKVIFEGASLQYLHSCVKNEFTFVPESKGSDLSIRQKTESGEYYVYQPYYTVSRVAFSKDGNRAMLKFGYHCAPLSGAREGLVTFKKQGRYWHIESAHKFWIS